MFSIILWSSLTRQHKKDALVDSAARGRLIALWNTVSLIRVFLQIQNEWIPKLVNTPSAVLHGPRSRYPKK